MQRRETLHPPRHCNQLGKMHFCSAAGDGDLYEHGLYHAGPKSVHLRIESKSVHTIQNAYFLYEVYGLLTCTGFGPVSVG